MGIFVSSEPVSTKSNFPGPTVIKNNSVTYGRTFHRLTALHKEILPSHFVFKHLFYSTVLLALRRSGRKGEDCTEILRWIRRTAVFLEGNSLDAGNNFVWTITVLVPGSVHRYFKPMICRSLCFFLRLSKTSHKFASISTVSGLHLTIYSPLDFLFSFWHFQYKSSACHFKLI